MKIAVDGVRLSRKPSGVTFIVVSIIKQLAIECPDWKICVLLRSDIHPLLKGILVEDNIEFLVSEPSLLNSKSLFWSLFQLNRIVNRLNPDYFIAPNTLLFPFFLNNKIKKIVFIHDLVFKIWPGTMSALNKIQMVALFKYSIKKSSLIWCNSNYTKREVLNYYGKETDKKNVFVGAGLNLDFKAALDKYNDHDNAVKKAEKPCIIFVGTFEPRKNILLLLDIYKELSDRYNLVLVGGKGWGNSEKEILNTINANGYPKDGVTIISQIKLDDLVELYKKAFFYITTSFNEGLGLPLLEAMACGCPIVAAHNSAMVEVVEGAGVTVKSWKINDWLSAIAQLEQNREHYIRLGYKRVANFNWENVITSLIQIL
jgi:glycosyltransferase involved in cell wall biosynthesis